METQGKNKNKKKKGFLSSNEPITVSVGWQIVCIPLIIAGICAIVCFTIFMNHNYKSEWNFPFQKFFCDYHLYVTFIHIGFSIINHINKLQRLTYSLPTYIS